MKGRIALLVCCVFVCGCAMPQERKVSSTEARMDETARSLVKARRAIDDTVAALVNLEGKSGEDLRQQYRSFVRRVRQLEDQERQVLARQNRLEAASKSYFDAWDRSLRRFRSSDLRRKSRQRRQLSIDSFNRMFDALQVEAEAYRMILNDLTDIRRYLGYDLTQQSVDAISSDIRKTVDDSREVQQKIDQAVRELNTTRTPLPAETQAVPPPAAATAPSGAPAQ